jgi:hypothetical protein
LDAISGETFEVAVFEGDALELVQLASVMRLMKKMKYLNIERKIVSGIVYLSCRPKRSVVETSA